MANSLKFGIIRITVKKVDGEWIAAYYEHNKFSESKTYYTLDGSNEGKADAMATAHAMIKKLRADAWKETQAFLSDHIIHIHIGE